MAKMTEKQDKAFDKKMGLKEGSKADIRKDKKMGLAVLIGMGKKKK